MQRIRIASIETREGDTDKGHWVSYILTGEDKTKVSTFDGKASSLKVGDTIEGEIELKGKFTNLKSFKVVGQSVPIQPEPQKASEKPIRGGTDREQSIEQSVAVKAIVELRVANALTDKSPEYQAVLTWCRERLGIPSITKPTKPDIAQAEKDSEELWPDGKPKTSPQPTKAKSSPVAEKSRVMVSKEVFEIPSGQQTAGFVDLGRLHESLKTLQDKGIKAYSNKTILSYLNAITRVKNETIAEAAAKLDQGQAQEFERRVQDALAMA